MRDGPRDNRISRPTNRLNVAVCANSKKDYSIFWIIFVEKMQVSLVGTLIKVALIISSTFSNWSRSGCSSSNFSMVRRWSPLMSPIIFELSSVASSSIEQKRRPRSDAEPFWSFSYNTMAPSCVKARASPIFLAVLKYRHNQNLSYHKIIFNKLLNQLIYEFWMTWESAWLNIWSISDITLTCILTQ